MNRRIGIIGHTMAFSLLGAALAAAGPLPEPVEAPKPLEMGITFRRPETRQERRRRLRQMGLKPFSARF